MNWSATALSLDAEVNKPVETAWAYEVAIRDPNAELCLFLNLAAIYFSANDVGYAAAHHLDVRFVDSAYYRSREVLEEAESRFGKHPEITAWLFHLDDRVLGQDSTPGAYEALSQQPNALLAQLLGGATATYQGRRAALEESLTESGIRCTERGRYMASLLSAHSAGLR